MDNIHKDSELTIEATNKKFLLVHQEGNCQEAVNTIISHAPFKINGIGDYQIIEFTPTMSCDERLKNIF